jgi:ubiquitin C-terminal hydrolase
MASLLVGRLDRHVQFPLALSLSQYMSESSKAKALHKLESYESSKAKGQARGGPGGDNRASHMQLYGIVVHSGESRGGGRYVAYIKDCHGGWWEMSDQSAFKTDEAHVLAQQAYMLFYLRAAEPLRQA